MNVGDVVFIDNGKIRTSVSEKTDGSLSLLVINGGAVSDGKGINVPNKQLSVPTLSSRDKKIINFAKEHDKFSVTMLSVGGELLEAVDIDRLAKLPTRDQALSMLMSVMQAPIAKFVRTLNEVPGKLVRTTAAVRDQKQQAA